MAITGAAERLVSTPFIRLSEVAKTYPSRGETVVHAVERVSVDIAQSEFTSIVGPSGCGKTTLLNMIGGLLPVSSGQIRYEGLKDGRKLPQLGMVFQDADLPPLKWSSLKYDFRMEDEIDGEEEAYG